MMSEITILHLSDIHCKKKKDEEKNAFRRDVQQKLVDAVKAHTGKSEHRAPDVVAVTGDIAFSGKKNEYDKALEFFNMLKAVLPGKTEFLVVPGNHDVDRDKVDRFFSLSKNIVQQELTDEFLVEADQVKNKINKKFNAFRSFARQLNPSFYKDTAGYFQVKHFPGKKISLLGLNSAWASESENDRFNIALGFQQLQDALEEAKSIPNRIVLMHHPPFNWLKDFEYEKTRVEMSRNCGLLLHGHTY